MAATILTVAGGLRAQTVVNPDISAVGDFRFLLRTDRTAEEVGEENAAFDFHEIEFNFNAYLNPYARADVYIGIHGTEGPVEVEQASATVLRGLPLSLQFTGGKYLLDLGKLNTQHPHQWGWLEMPLMHRSFLGEEGARVVGVNLSSMKPLGDNAVTLSANAFGADFVHSHDHEEHSEDEHEHHAPALNQEEEHHDEEAPARIGYSGRLSLFRSLTEFTSLEAGVSYLYAETDPTHQDKRNLAGFDFKLKWRPDMYRALVWIVEGMYSDRRWIHEHDGEHEKEDNQALGGFTALEYRFRRVFDVGTFGDYGEDAQHSGLIAKAFGAYVGYMPAEETVRFSIVYRHEDSDYFHHNHDTVIFQIVWALGPHKPHPF
jgi:hypothetical protein